MPPHFDVSFIKSCTFEGLQNLGERCTPCSIIGQIHQFFNGQFGTIAFRHVNVVLSNSAVFPLSGSECLFQKADLMTASV